MDIAEFMGWPRGFSDTATNRDWQTYIHRLERALEHLADRLDPATSPHPPHCIGCTVYIAEAKKLKVVDDSD